MRILAYSSYFYPYISGLSLYPLRIFKHLSTKHKITVLTFSHLRNLKKEEVYMGIKINRMGNLLRISKGFISPLSILDFVKYAINNDIIVVILPNFEALPLVLIGRLLGKKIISIFCCEVFLGKDIVSRIIVFFLNISVFLQLFLSEVIIAFPDYIESLFIYRLFRKKIITTIPIIEDKKVSKETLKRFKGEKKEDIWIGFVGRVACEKGVEYLINAATKINRKIPIKLIFVGPGKNDVVGENHYFKEIEEKLNRNKIPHKFIGVLSDENLGAFYKAIDVLVLPSVNKTEAFGMVQAEAMLSGTPVVASDLPGVRVPIGLTGMGLIAKPGNSDSLYNAIKLVLDNREKFLTRKMIEKARSEFSSEKVIDLYRKLFDGLNNVSIGKKF